MADQLETEFVPKARPYVSAAATIAAGIIREFEQGPDGGFAKVPYKCPGGEWTIGWGHAIQEGIELAYFEAGIDEDDAERLMFQDLAKAELLLEKYCTCALTVYQRAALISFIFNVGEEHWRSSTLLKRLNDGDLGQAPTELARWVHADGKVLEGLIRRRQCEISIGGPW